jgi:hypothetical protein
VLPDEVELLEEAAGFAASFFGFSDEEEEDEDPEEEDDDEDDADPESDAGFARESVR